MAAFASVTIMVRKFRIMASRAVDSQQILVTVPVTITVSMLTPELRGALPGRFFSEDGRELPEVVVHLLRDRSLTIGLGESCTGGLLAARLTQVPGASAVLERGFVTYANRAKVEELGVDAALLEGHGAVSAEVAAAMAAGARRAARTDVGVGVTGIAGPDGGTPEKPVGLVFVATDGAAGTRVRRAVFPGARERVRHQATQVALEMIRRGILVNPNEKIYISIAHTDADVDGALEPERRARVVEPFDHVVHVHRAAGAGPRTAGAHVHRAARRRKACRKVPPPKTRSRSLPCWRA
jgi:PncC family amidohydrolase